MLKPSLIFVTLALNEDEHDMCCIISIPLEFGLRQQFRITHCFMYLNDFKKRNYLLILKNSTKIHITRKKL